ASTEALTETASAAGSTRSILRRMAGPSTKSVERFDAGEKVTGKLGLKRVRRPDPQSKEYSTHASQDRNAKTPRPESLWVQRLPQPRRLRSARSSADPFVPAASSCETILYSAMEPAH